MKKNKYFKGISIVLIVLLITCLGVKVDLSRNGVLNLRAETVNAADYTFTNFSCGRDTYVSGGISINNNKVNVDITLNSGYLLGSGGVATLKTTTKGNYGLNIETYYNTYRIYGSVNLDSSWIGTKIWNVSGTYRTAYTSNMYEGYANPDPNITITADMIDTAPVLSVISPSQDNVFSETDTTIKPTISVSDFDNDTLTCKYYVDSETSPRGTETVTNTSSLQSITFTNGIDFSILSDGNHTIKFEASDGRLNPVSQIISVNVDKSAPIINSVTTSSAYNSITLSGTATDAIAGLDPYPYRYTIGTTPTNWLTEATNTWNNLIPNTQYDLKFEARDAKGHIAANTQSIKTKAQPPALTVDNPSSYTVDLTTADNNPVNTQYQISVNNGASYVTSEGKLTTGSTWMTFPASKKLTVSGLTPDTTYNFTIKAKNAENIETVTSSASGTTLVAPPGSPANIVATATNNSITVAWDPVADASGYDIEADGTVIDTGKSTSYTITGLTQNTQHTFKVRSKGVGGAGNWSTPITKSTLPNSPGVPINITAAPSSNSITIVWDSVGGATGYDIEVDGQVVNNGPTTNYTHRGLAPGTHHEYKVRSINPGGKSEWSPVVNASTTAEAPSVPANLSAAPTHTEIVVSWDPITGASYDIEVDGTIIDNSTRTSYTHTGLTAGTEYRYRVRSKKNGSVGDWSAALTISTLPNEFGVPANIQAAAGDTAVTITWDAVPGATGYEVDADGTIIDNGSSNTCIHNNLAPGSQHSYQIRAKNAAQTSDWSPAVNITTNLLAAPANLTATATESSITVTWNTVTGAALYDLDVDGTVTENLTNTSYTCTGLLPNTQHTFKVRAKNEAGVSAWTIPLAKSTAFSGANIPAKVTAMSGSTSITLLWSGVEGATAYDIEIDGTATSDITGTSYKHTGLAAGTQHKYRVRAKSSSGTGNWSNLITVSTLPLGPAVPVNLTTTASTTTIQLTWDAAENAASYEIEADNVVIPVGQGTSYLHTGLSPNTEHKYRIRSKNSNGTSAWSEMKTISTKSSTETFTLSCAADEIFNLQFEANDMSSPDSVSYTITYDATQLDVTDLCSTTAKQDLAPGYIAGSDIKIVQFVPGTITFIKTGITSPGEAWTGFVNSIKFKSKVEGPVTITYSIN